MDLKIFQQTKPVTSPNVLVAAITDPDAPTVIIGVPYVIPQPYTGQTQLVNFNDLDAIVYQYTLYESPDGTATGTVRNSFQIQPSNNSYNVREDIFLVADISAFIASGTNFYGQDASLIGWDWYVEQVPATMQPDVEYSKTIAGVPTLISDINADGWVLLISGALINKNQKFVIHFYPQLNSVPSGSSSKVIGSTILVTATMPLDASAQNAAVLIQGAAGYLDVTLPQLTTIQDNKPIWIDSAGGSHINVGINAFAGDKINYAGGVPKIILGQDEGLMMYKYTFPAPTGAQWVILGGVPDGVKNVGQIIYSYTRTMPNTLFADGRQNISRVNYARLAAWALLLPNLIPGANFNNTFNIDGTVYEVNNGYYSTGSGAGLFGIPNIFRYGFIRAADGSSRLPGDFNALMILLHKHDSLIGALATRPNGFGPSKSAGFYNGLHTTVTDLSGPPLMDPGPNTQAVPMLRLGTENRPDNISAYASICC